MKRLCLTGAAALAVWPALASGALVSAVTEISPSGTFDGTGGDVVNVVSLTVGGYVITDLVGPPDENHVELVGSFDSTRARKLPAVPARSTLVGINMGYACLGLAVNAPGEAMRAYFASPVPADGTDRPELFVLEWARGTDTFDVELLTNGPGETVTVAAVVRVNATDYTQTTTIINTTLSGSGQYQPVSGVGINLDQAGVTGIRGMQIRSDTNSGVDTCTFLAVPEPLTAMLLGLGLPLLVRRHGKV